MDPEYSHKLLHAVRTRAATHPSDPQTLLQEVYSAIIQGDFDAFGRSIADDVELNISGFGPLDGTWRGRSAVVEATRKNFGLVDAQQPEVETMIAQGDSVAVLMRETGKFKSNGQNYKLRAVQWFTFADGKIAKIDEIVAGFTN
jgi:uncharacterized protein